MRKLNEIVKLMDAFSRIEQTAYSDVVQLAKGIHHGCEKINPNYFYSSRSMHSGTIYYSGMEDFFRFKELKPYPDKSLPAYMTDWIPYLQAREKITALTYGKDGTAELSSAVTNYMVSADSLFYKHISLTDYVSENDYENDFSFEKGKQILKDMSRLFAVCYANGEVLHSVLMSCFYTTFPPNNFHPVLQPAERASVQCRPVKHLAKEAL